MTEPAEGLKLRDRYTLRRRLGRGGMAEVWLGETPDGRRLALKILSRDLAARPDMVRLFAQEAAHVGRLDHPGIARLIDTGEYEGRPYIVTDYVDGADLSSLRGGQPKVLAGVFADVADALSAAHRAGVIHRDLKPSNVLLGSDGRPRIVDFGIAAAIGGGLSVAGGGSGDFASPEQRAGRPPAVTDDAWGLGRLIHTCLAPADRASPLGELARRLTAPSALERSSDLSVVRDELLAMAGRAAPTAGAGGAETLTAIRPEGLRHPVPPGSRLPPAAGPRPQAPASRRWLWGSLAVLVALLVVVVFLLPGWVEEKRAETPPPVRAPEAAAEDPKEAIRKLVEQKRSADAVRSELDPMVAAFEATGPVRWAAAELEAVRASLAAGDEAYARRDYEAAGRAWSEAGRVIEEANGHIPEVRDQALAAGARALEEGDSAAAAGAFGLAAAVDPASAAARAGLARAEVLDDVLAAMQAGEAAEREGRLSDARQAYARAAELDPLWAAASAGVQRMTRALGDARFFEAMSRGYAALERGDFAGAREAFQSARSMKPASAEVGDALAQVETARRAEAVRRLAAEAEVAESEERWSDAAVAWKGVLAEDGSVALAQDRLVRAQARAELAERIEGFLADPFRLTSPDVSRAARAALTDAGAAAAPRSRLEGRVTELARQLELAEAPVEVVLESDGVTEVVLYRVGRLGAFSRRQLALKPGRYTAVGSRPGYRDVRREFLVRPGQPMPGPVVVVSEEPI
jgi:tetratricopeptide (TPR) repeat protein